MLCPSSWNSTKLATVTSRPVCFTRTSSQSHHRIGQLKLKLKTIKNKYEVKKCLCAIGCNVESKLVWLPGTCLEMGVTRAKVGLTRLFEREVRAKMRSYIYMYTYGICIFHIISFRCQIIRIYINEILFYFAKLHADLATTLSKISKENWHQSKRQQNPSSETKHVPVLHCTVAVTCKITLKTGLLAKSGLLFQRVWVQLTDFCFIVPSNMKKGQKRKRRSLFSNAANSISA